MGTQAEKTKSINSRRDLSAVSYGVISFHIMRWSAVISLPLRHWAYVVARSVSNLFTAKHLVARLNVVKNRIAMAPNVKGFALETFLSGKFPLWYFQFSPLASPHDSVQMWADPAATTIILLCVCLEVWCISLFIVVYILMTSSICVILFGCCSLTNFARSH